VVFAVALVAVVALFMYGGGEQLTTTGQIVTEEGETVGAWSNTIVKYKLSVKDEFTGADVAATAKVYDEEPEDWNNPRGDFDEAKDFTSYTASGGEVEIDDETPGKYYVVMTASGYNTEFVEISIPDGSGRDIDVADYNAAPDIKSSPMTQVGSTTDEDFAFTLVNDSSAEEKDTILLTIADNTEFRGWKAIINDEEGFSVDTDGDGDYDEGVSRFMVEIGGVDVTLFDPDRGIDEFNTEDEYTLLLDDLNIADGDDLTIKVEVDAATGDYVGANDEVWGEGEGVDVPVCPSREHRRSTATCHR
jgi:hypothetical protein